MLFRCSHPTPVCCSQSRFLFTSKSLALSSIDADFIKRSVRNRGIHQLISVRVGARAVVRRMQCTPRCLLLVCLLLHGVCAAKFPRSAARLAVRPRTSLPATAATLHSSSIIDASQRVISCAGDISTEVAAFAQVWVRHTVAGTEPCDQSMGLIEECLEDDTQLLALEGAMRQLRVATGQWPSARY